MIPSIHLREGVHEPTTKTRFAGFGWSDTVRPVRLGREQRNRHEYLDAGGRRLADGFWRIARLEHGRQGRSQSILKGAYHMQRRRNFELRRSVTKVLCGMSAFAALSSALSTARAQNAFVSATGTFNATSGQFIDFNFTNSSTDP